MNSKESNSYDSQNKYSFNDNSTKVPFLKEAMSNLKENSVLVVLNQKQLKPSINYVIENFLKEKEKTIFISTQGQETSFQIEKQENFFVIDLYSREKNTQLDKNKFYFVQNPANLTDIQIGIEKFLKNNNNKSTIFFDSINSLTIHSSPKSISKFFYMFINKTSLQGNSLLLFIVKESINEEILQTIKQFCGKTYDYSKVFISSIELEH